MTNNIYSLKFNLTRHPHETYYISKYIHESEEGIAPKIIGAIVELLINGYLQNASYQNIKECFELLITNQKEDIDWKNSTEINDLLEKYF